MRSIVLLLVAVALAGCSDGDSPDPVDDTFKPVATGDDVGAISGVVVDVTIVPVEGATVTLADGSTATTDVDGTFVFESLEPGAYFLTVEAPLFFPTQSSAEVEAGEVTRLRVQLQPDLTPLPYHDTEQFAGFAAAWAGIGGWVWDISAGPATGIRACEACEFPFTADGGLETVVLEAAWEHSIDPGAAGDQLLGYYMGLEWEGDLDTEYVDSGDTFHVQRELFGDSREFVATLYPDDVWPGLEQHYDLYVTKFYLEPADADWSFIAQG